MLSDMVEAVYTPTTRSQRLEVEVYTPKGRLDALPKTLTRLLERTSGWSCKGKLVVKLPVELGVGYGASGALVLASALALSPCLRTSLRKLAAEAHASEVEARTGLGDVIVEYEAEMMEVRVKPGAPGIGVVESFPVDQKLLLTVPLAKIDTSLMLKSISRKVYQEAERMLEHLLEEPTLDRLLEESRKFSTAAGFAPQDLAQKLDGMVAQGLLRGWYVKKGVLVAVPEADRLEDVIDQVTRLIGVKPRLHSIGYERAKLVVDEA